MHEPKVADWMDTRVRPLRCGTDLGVVVDALLQSGLTGLPVVDDEERVIGFVSEQDCIHSLLISSYHCEGAPRVNDVMHDQPASVREDDSVLALAQAMETDRPKIYPVVDNDGRYRGLIGRAHVLQALRSARQACAA